MIRFSVFGIPVQVHAFFWISLAVIGGALDAKTSEAVLEIGLFLIAGFISVLIHELGHALTARKFGARTEIVLEAFGGYAAYSGVRLSRTQSFLVTAAGPAVQIVLGLMVMWTIPRLPEISQFGKYFLGKLMEISLIWAILNLLPVLPLDGGRMLESILGPRKIKITLWVSVIVAAAVGVGAFLKTQNILLPIFMGMFAWQSWQALQRIR